MEKIETRVISADYHLVLKILRYGGMTGNFCQHGYCLFDSLRSFLICTNKHTINKPCLDSLSRIRATVLVNPISGTTFLSLSGQSA